MGRWIALAAATVVIAAGSAAGTASAAACGPTTGQLCKGLNVITNGASLSAAMDWLSPDDVLFQSYDTLQIAHLKLGSVETVLPSGASLWWKALSPDREHFVYVDNDNSAIEVQSVKQPGSPTVLASYAAASLQDPIWRADGKSIAYGNDYVGGEIDTVPASGGVPTVLMPADSSTMRQVIAYLRNGQVIVQQYDRSGNNGQLLSVSPAGTVTTLTADGFGGTVSPNGAKVVYIDSSGDLMAIPTAGGTPTYLGVSGLATYNTPYGVSAFSPDSSRIVIAYTSSVSSHPVDAIAKLDGSGAIALSGFSGWATDWSPDGKTIAFTGSDSSGQQALMTVRPDGSGFVELVQAEVSVPYFSPDSQKIALIDEDTGSNDLAVFVR